MTEDDKSHQDKDFFDLFDINFDELEKIFEKLIKKMRDKLESDGDFKNIFQGIEPGHPFIHGFSIAFNSQGEPQFNEFGHYIDEQSRISEEREPLTDVIEDENMISVTVELPGVEQEDIDISVTHDTLEIHVDTPHRKYHKSLSLPARVRDDLTTVTFKNGVLDIELTKSEDNGFSVKVA